MSTKIYEGFEAGPIRPPSESGSLMLRVTRNCPWNKCKFCSLYKGEKFSIRPVEHIIQDIDSLKENVNLINKIFENGSDRPSAELNKIQTGMTEHERMAMFSALNWVRGGMKSIFLQDANTLLIKPEDLIYILKYLKKTFPQTERITSYARSHTAARISDENLKNMADAGLNRIHIGMETASDDVLKFIRKGVDKKTHITAGQKVKRAGIELSEYFMPGIGGKEYIETNALETADAINEINPDFIRIRTLAVPESTELYKDVLSGKFIPLNDVEKADELLMFFENLKGITSTVKSDHILNLFQDAEGTLPDDKEKITAPIHKFRELSKDDKLLYIAGRRTGIFSTLADMENSSLVSHTQQTIKAHGVTHDNLHTWASDIMARFI